MCRFQPHAGFTGPLCTVKFNCMAWRKIAKNWLDCTKEDGVVLPSKRIRSRRHSDSLKDSRRNKLSLRRRNVITSFPVDDVTFSLVTIRNRTNLKIKIPISHTISQETTVRNNSVPLYVQSPCSSMNNSVYTGEPAIN